MFLMTFGAMILFNLVATLGGGVFATLGLGAATLGAGVPVLTVGCVPVLTVGCVPVCTVGHSGVCHPAKMAVNPE